MWKYKGNGYVIGIPARDIPEDEFSRMSKEEQELIKSSKLYELVKKQGAKDTQEK